MVAVEAMASGKPLIALGRGGVLESVPTDGSGAAVFYQEPGDAQLEAAIKRFEEIEQLVRPGELQEWATQFSESRFKESMLGVLRGKEEPTQVAVPMPSVLAGWHD